MSNGEGLPPFITFSTTTTPGGGPQDTNAFGFTEAEALLFWLQFLNPSDPQRQVVQAQIDGVSFPGLPPSTPPGPQTPPPIPIPVPSLFEAAQSQRPLFFLPRGGLSDLTTSGISSLVNSKNPEVARASTLIWGVILRGLVKGIQRVLPKIPKRIPRRTPRIPRRPGPEIPKPRPVRPRRPVRIPRRRERPDFPGPITPFPFPLPLPTRVPTPRPEPRAPIPDAPRSPIRRAQPIPFPFRFPRPVAPAGPAVPVPRPTPPAPVPRPSPEDPEETLEREAEEERQTQRQSQIDPLQFTSVPFFRTVGIPGIPAPSLRPPVRDEDLLDDLTDPERGLLELPQQSPVSQEDLCRACAQTKQRRRKKRRTCQIRRNTVWASGPQKGKLAGSKCARRGPEVSGAASRALRSIGL